MKAKQASKEIKPPKLTGGKLNYKTELNFIKGTTAVLECFQGWVAPFNNEFTIIKENGKLKWDPPEMACFLTAASSFPMKGDNVIGFTTPFTRPFTLNQFVTPICAPGYVAKRESRATVIFRNGTLVWDKDTVHCFSNSCPPPSKIPFSIPDDRIYMYNDTFNYRCQEGYDLIHSKFHRCVDPGIWVPPLGGERCDPVQCPDNLKAPVHGTVDMTSRNFKSIATYSCDQGYTLVDGDIQRTCQADKTWSGKEGRCEPIPFNPKPPVSKSSAPNSVPWVVWIFLSMLLILIGWCIRTGSRENPKRGN